MIGAVHLAVAVHAVLPKHVGGRCRRRQATFVLRNTWVTALCVTALAQHRSAHCEHAAMIGSVRIMAGYAVLRHRSMLPKEGAAKFCMAVITGVIDRLAGQQQFRGFAVRVVAATAIHLALSHGMRVGLHRLRTLLLVTIETDFRLTIRCQHRVALRVAGVAIGAGDGVVVMRTAVPGKASVVLVAVRTVSVLLGDRCGRIRSEHYNRRSFLAAADTTGVVTTGSVAGLALQLTVTKWRAWVARHRMWRSEYGQCYLVVMAGKTGVGTFSTV